MLACQPTTPPATPSRRAPLATRCVLDNTAAKADGSTPLPRHMTTHAMHDRPPPSHCTALDPVTLPPLMTTRPPGAYTSRPFIAPS